MNLDGRCFNHPDRPYTHGAVRRCIHRHVCGRCADTLADDGWAVTPFTLRIQLLGQRVEDERQAGGKIR
jgi:hypothetical protein